MLKVTETNETLLERKLSLPHSHMNGFLENMENNI